MIAPIAFPPGAHVYAGQETPRAEIIAASRKQLLDAGWHHLEVDEVLADRPGLVVPAYWAGDQLGFCGPEYAGAIAVTVVNLPISSQASS